LGVPPAQLADYDDLRACVRDAVSRGLGLLVWID
jgi:hypothetical protein